MQSVIKNDGGSMEVCEVVVRVVCYREHHSCIVLKAVTCIGCVTSNNFLRFSIFRSIPYYTEKELLKGNGVFFGPSFSYRKLNHF